jgi:hypothetical protein
MPPHIVSHTFYYPFTYYAEKYLLKMRTWDTAGAYKDYDMYNFMDRLSGFHFDNSAVSWGCQLREVLRNRTGQQNYVRPGTFWLVTQCVSRISSICVIGYYRCRVLVSLWDENVA